MAFGKKQSGEDALPPSDAADQTASVEGALTAALAEAPKPAAKALTLEERVARMERHLIAQGAPFE